MHRNSGGRNAVKRCVQPIISIDLDGVMGYMVLVILNGRQMRMRMRKDFLLIRLVVSDSDSGDNVVNGGDAAYDGYTTPPPSNGTCFSRMLTDNATPKTADFMDMLDSDGVPRRGVRRNKVWKFMIENYSSDLEEAGNVLVVGLRDKSRYPEAIKCAEDMIERGNMPCPTRGKSLFMKNFYVSGTIISTC